MRPKTEEDQGDPPDSGPSGPRLVDATRNAAPEPPVSGDAQVPPSAHVARPAQPGSAGVPAQVPPQTLPGPGAPPPATIPSTPPQPAVQAPRPARSGGRGARLLLVLILIVGAGAGYGGYWWYALRGTVSTDDAYVDARIVSLAARLSERVDSVRVSEGDPVKRGQPLARFADDKLRIRVRETRAEVRSAAAALEEARNAPRPEEIEVARAEVRVHEVGLELQQKEWQRAQQLSRVRAISAQELERRRAAVASAESQLDVARRRLVLLQAGSRPEQIEQAEAALALAQSRLQGALSDLAEADLRAPVDGIVAKQMVDPGEVVQKGQALFQIVEAGKTWVVANVEEDQIAVIREGQRVRIWVDAYPGREFGGRVGPLYAATLSRFSLLPSASASGSFIKVTQRVPVRIDWVDEKLPPVYPGLNVVVRIAVDRP